MLIVIEGLSRSGKTTLAKELSKRMNITHHGRRPPNALVDADRWLYDPYVVGKGHALLDIDWRNTDLIMDRQLPSSAGYSILRDHNEGRGTWFPVFQTLDQQTECVYIYLNWTGPMEALHTALLHDESSTDMTLDDLRMFEADMVKLMFEGPNPVIEISTHRDYGLRRPVDNLADEVMAQLNQMRISWTDYFMSMAHLAKRRSTGLTRHVGAVITLDNKVVGIGYNGAPSGVPHCTVNPRAGMKSGENLNLERTVHAEINAILNASGPLKGGTIYTTTQPCGECTKAIIKSGIVEIVFDVSYPDKVAAELLSYVPHIEVTKWES